jgi:hypothetical protein
MPPTRLADEIVGKVAAVDQRTFGDAPAPPQPAWWPQEGPGNPHFRGRGAELWSLHNDLRARNKDRDKGLPIVSVRASGGEGKTALCLQYARWFARDHSGGVFVIRLQGSDARFSDGETAVRTRYLGAVREIAERLGLEIPSGEHGPLVALRRMLSTTDAPYLWIVDDIPSTGAAMVKWMSAPTGLGKTLITTRGRFGAGDDISAELDLGRLDPNAAMAILTAHRRAQGAVERKAISDIIAQLDTHPLALRLAAGLTIGDTFTGFPNLHATLSSAEPDVLELAAQLGGGLTGGTAKSLSRALLRSYDAIDRRTQQVLTAASVLAPSPIPMRLLEFMVADADLTGAVSQAHDRALVTLVGDDAFVMHPLTARAVRVQTGVAGRSELRRRAVARLTAVVEAKSGELAPGEVVRHLPHVRAVVGLLPGGDSVTMSIADRYLLNETGRAQVEQGDPGAAVASFEALYDACRDSPAVDALTRYAVLVGLAVAVGLNGELSTALDLKQRAADDLKRELGDDQQETWTARNNLAVSYLDAREYLQARDVFRAVHGWRCRNLGPSHRETLVALGNLAIAHAYLEGSPAEQRRHHLAAHRLLIAAESRWRQVASTDDPAVLDVWNSLALSHRRLGQRAEARELSARVVAGRTAVLGEMHPDAVDALENLAILQHEAGEPGTSFHDLFLRRFVVQGPEHPSTMRAMLNLLPSGTGPDDQDSYLTVADDVPAPIGEVRLEGDYVELEIDLTTRAIDFQDACVEEYGSDDPRTMAATAYLAYCHAVSDHIDGSIEDASALAENAYGGLADARDDALEDERSPAELVEMLERETEIADRIRQWINRLSEAAQE